MKNLTVSQVINTVKDLQTSADFAASGDNALDQDFNDVANWLQALVDNGHLKAGTAYSDTKLPTAN